MSEAQSVLIILAALTVVWLGRFFFDLRSRK